MKKSYDTITKGLSTMVGQLRDLAKANQNKAKLAGLEADRLHAKVSNLRQEANKANNTADKVAALIGSE